MPTPFEAAHLFGYVFAVCGHDRAVADQVLELRLLPAHDGDGHRLQTVEIVWQATFHEPARLETPPSYRFGADQLNGGTIRLDSFPENLGQMTGQRRNQERRCDWRGNRGDAYRGEIQCTGVKLGCINSDPSAIRGPEDLHLAGGCGSRQKTATQSGWFAAVPFHCGVCNSHDLLREAVEPVEADLPRQEPARTIALRRIVVGVFSISAQRQDLLFDA